MSDLALRACCTIPQCAIIFRMAEKKQRTEYKCANCKILVYKLESQLTMSKNVYCSRECSHKGRQNGSVLFCHLCDSPFYRRFGEQLGRNRKNSARQFCSRECYSEWRYLSTKSHTYRKIDGKHIHRVIAESVIGRDLTSQEVVHHIDLNKHNNDIGNLALLPNQSLHAKIHFGKVKIEDVLKYSLVNFIKEEKN